MGKSNELESTLQASELMRGLDAFLVPKMLFEPIELRVPEPLVLVNPAVDLCERFAAKGDEDFAPLSSAPNKTGSFQQFEVFGHRV